MLASFLLLGLLFLLPFVVSPAGALYFEPPKVLVAEVLIELLLLLVLFKNYPYKAKIKPIHLVLVCLLFLLSIYDLVANSSGNLFFGNIFRLQGILLFWHLLVFSLLVPFLNLPKLHKSYYLIVLAALFLSTLMMGRTASGRFVGPLGEPNALAATTIFILPFILFKSSRLLKVSGLLVGVVIIILSGSRSGLIALFLEVLLVFLNKKLRISLKVSFSICFILFVLTFFLPLIEGGDWFENRAEVWQTAFMAGLKSPLIGSGFGNIQTILHQTSVSLGNNIQYQVVDSSHNFLLDYWVEGGIIGILSIIFIMAFAITNFIKKNQILGLTLFLGLIVVMSFNPVSVVTLVGFWFLIGQGCKNSPIEDD